MEYLWSWICELPSSDEWSSDSNSELSFHLASSTPKTQTNTKSIELKARRKFSSNSDLVAITFYVSYEEKALWVSDTCHVHSDKPFLPLVLQLLQEVISRSPTAGHDGVETTCPRSQLQKLKPEPVAWILDTHSPESFSSFFNLAFLARLFWLCVCDAPSEVGSLYFHSILAPNLVAFSCTHSPVLRAFFVSAGIDVELCVMRTFGYMLTKWLMFREVGVGLQLLTPSHNLGFSYAAETHGLWVLKGYAPLLAMTPTCSNRANNGYSVLEAKESVLKYALAHQQLEAVIQLEYSVEFKENFISVNARVDNIRIHVSRLGFSKAEDNSYVNEKHFPSRIRVWVGPENGASYVTSLTLGRSTDNIEKEKGTQKILKGNFGKTKVPKMKAITKTIANTKSRTWRCDQDSDGHVAIFDTTLHDTMTGSEIATWQPHVGDSGGKGRGNVDQAGQSFQKRYVGANRSFTKSGNWVFVGEAEEGVKWRLNKEMEGSVLKWRIACQIWVSYFPNEVKSSYFETRRVEWCDEVDLPLIIGA